MIGPANPEFALDAAKLGCRDEPERGGEQHPGAAQGAIDKGAGGYGRTASKAVVAWTQILEIWAAIECRFR
ncbi:hypothetical protein [Bradyrhizobium sp. dw_78]|uniref:hypothetical protein n=1 Tax=Bradyrhizobium sp. dw_78 TaxID=2719793 RepID=UPI001BD2CF2D|nr:hypothetical protein [Bradyrhizobium sp. dw_78]